MKHWRHLGDNTRTKPRDKAEWLVSKYGNGNLQNVIDIDLKERTFKFHTNGVLNVWFFFRFYTNKLKYRTVELHVWQLRKTNHMKRIELVQL